MREKRCGKISSCPGSAVETLVVAASVGEVRGMDDIMRSVMDVARRHVKAEDASALDDPDADLSAIGVDSLEMVSFIFDLETSFSIEFPADMIVPETFLTMGTVADSIRAVRERGDRA
jgi:acyl carrier protein